MTIKIPSFKISSPALTLIMAVFFTAVLNLAFWRKMMAAVDAEQAVPMGFTLSLPIAMVALFFIIFSIFSFIRIEKIVFLILIPLSAAANFTTYIYGIQIDDNMIANIMETTSTEASSYLNLEFATWFFATGILPFILLLMTKIKRPAIKKDTITKITALAAAILVMVGIGALYSVDYMTVMRNNKGVEKNAVPTYFLSSTFKYFKRKYVNDTIPFTPMGQDATITTKPANNKKDVVVLILGETARAQNYELNGYNRPTNAHTKNMDVVSFQDVSSCGTATAISVPCMFSFMGREEYQENIAKKQSNVMDVLTTAGYNTLWIENDEGCKGVCARIPTIIVDKTVQPFCDGSICRDDMLLKDIDAHISAMSDKGGVVVIHIMGSHGPTYYKRYPETHRAFSPDCPRSDIQNCTKEEIINTYDNTILFTDFIIAETIKTLKARQKDINPSLLYVSDHGESLGENGIYLHGMPYAIAPKEQTHVPLIFWTTPDVAKAKNINLSCLNKTAKTKEYSHDNLSHSLLGYMGVSTKLYNPALDLFKECRI